MRAAVTAGPGEPLAVIDLPDPTPGPTELVLAVTRCGICGSDLHSAHLAPGGTVLGHEFAGEIVAVGTEVQDRWREGQRVAAFPLVGCGRCRACLTGRTQRCAEVQLVGFTRPGGFAQYAAVGAAESLALPDQLSDAEGALIEPLAVGLYAYRRTALRAGEPLLVIGGGPVGLAVLVWARHLGVGPVVVSEPAAGRRAIAERLGAITIDPTSHDLAEEFRRLTGQAPSAIVESAGKPGVVDAAMAVAGEDARITVAGLCTVPDTVSHLTGLFKGLTLNYVLYYERGDYDTAVRLLADDRFDAEPLLTDTIGLDDLPPRFEALKQPGDDVKVQVDPPRMSDTLEHRVPLPRDDVVLVPDEPGSVLVSPEGAVLQIDEQARLLWTLFDGEVRLGELADDVVAVFDVDRDRVLVDLGRLTDQLAAHGMLLPRDETAVPVPAGSADAYVGVPPPCCGSRLAEEVWLPTLPCRIAGRTVGVRTQDATVDRALHTLLAELVGPSDPDVPPNLSLVLRPGVPAQLELHSQLRFVARSPSAAHIRHALLLELGSLAGLPADALHLDAFAIGDDHGVVLLPGPQRPGLQFLLPALTARGLAIGSATVAVDPASAEVVVVSPLSDDPARSQPFDRLLDWAHDGPRLLAPGRHRVAALGLGPSAPSAAGETPRSERADLLGRALPLLRPQATLTFPDAVAALLALVDAVEVAAPDPSDLLGWIDRHLGR